MGTLWAQEATGGHFMLVVRVCDMGCDRDLRRCESTSCKQGTQWTQITPAKRGPGVACAKPQRTFVQAKPRELLSSHTLKGLDAE